MSAEHDVDIDVPVLVVGGSMIGLATAMFLAQHGVEVLSVEKHHGTAIHPRAGYFQLRTNELMRVAGIEDRVRAASLALYDPDGGHEQRASRCTAARSPASSPTSTPAWRSSARLDG